MRVRVRVRVRVCVCVCDAMPITVHEHSTWIDIMLCISMCSLLLLGVTCSGVSISCAMIFLTGKHANPDTYGTL